MADTTTGTIEVAQDSTVTDRIADAVRHATHFSHEARLLRSMAEDMREEGIHAAKRLMTRARRRAEALEDLKDDAIHYVKRQPVQAIGMAVGAGLIVGVAVGWIGRRCAERQVDTDAQH